MKITPASQIPERDSYGRKFVEHNGSMKAAKNVKEPFSLTVAPRSNVTEYNDITTKRIRLQKTPYTPTSK